jgi:hypothetical protein
MRILVVVIISCLLASPVLATVDSDPDQIGVYFDQNADEVCLDDVPMAEIFPVYIVMTNPSSAEVNGVEFSFCAEGVSGSLMVLDATWSPAFWIDMGMPDLCSDGWMLSADYPVPQVDANVVLCEFSYMLMAEGAEFYIGPVSNPSIDDGLPAYVGAGDEIISLGVSTGNPGLPVAMVNGDCGIVAVESRTFAGVKSLYR